MYRDLAHVMGHPWAEYWDFLDSFVDLSSTEGLRKLDEYLSKRDFSPLAHEEAGENETSNRFKTPSPGTFTFSTVYQGSYLGIGLVFSVMETLPNGFK